MGRFFSGGFVVEDTVEFTPFGEGLIIATGVVRSLGDIRLDVHKVLTVVEGSGPHALVQTTDYSYNASIRQGNILRYDSPHESHRPFHHVHRFDVFNGDSEGTIGGSDWPTLGAVIQELWDWHNENYNRLYPTFELGKD